MENKPFSLLLFYFVYILLFSTLGCKKAPEEPTPPPITVLPNSAISNVKLDSLFSVSFVLSYQLAAPASITGVAYSLDSANLSTDHPSTFIAEGQLNGSKYAVKGKFLPENSSSRFWFKIYFVDAFGGKIYSKIYKEDLAPSLLRNKYVVVGKYIDNAHPKNFFINYEGGALGALDNSLNVSFTKFDDSGAEYSASIGGKSTNVNVSFGNGTLSLDIDVPESTPLGSSKLDIYKSGKPIYSDYVTVVNGGLVNAVKHPVSFATRSYFSYGDELYTFNLEYLPTVDGKFHKWSPSTNIWTELPNPIEMQTRTTTVPPVGINGILYFSPLPERKLLDFMTLKSDYSEVIRTFNTKTNTWGKIVVFNTKDETKVRNIDIQSSFAYQNKLYCIARESTGEQYGPSKVNLRVFNPVDQSWSVFMEMPSNGWFCNTVVSGGKVYLLQSNAGKQESATTWFVNEFIEIDMSKKLLINKNWIRDRSVGVAKSYLAGANGKIYAYGGLNSSGYSSIYSSFFAVYDPALDNWTSVSSYSYFTAWVSQTDGLFLAVNDRLYVGLGLDRYTNGHIDGGKRNNMIYQISMK